MTDEQKAKKWDKLTESITNGINPVEINNERYIIISEELVRGMTEETNWNQAPRSDCG